MPTWKQLKRFCENDQWELYKSTNHYYYRKRDADGTIRHAKVSFGTGEIGKHLWCQILKRQLQVSEEYFNSKI